MDQNQKITLIIAGISLVVSLGTCFYTTLYHHNSLIGRIVKVWKDGPDIPQHKKCK